MKRSEVAQLIDHTLLTPTSVYSQFLQEAEFALNSGVASFCLRPDMVKSISKQFPRLTLCTVVGFPHGSNALDIKMSEIKKAVDDGAKEIDVVINLSSVAAGNWAEVEDEIAAETSLCQQLQVVSKFIFETGYWEVNQISRLCEIASKCGADFVKTSTGFAYMKQIDGNMVASGATVDAITTMKNSVSNSTRIKASGGIRTLDSLLLMHRSGASRIGSSATRSILLDCAE